MRPWFCRGAWAVAELCLVLRSLSGFLSSSSHHSHGFYLLFLQRELPAPAALWILPVPEKSHRLFLLLQGYKGSES